MNTRCTKIKKPFVEYKKVNDINLKIKGSRFMPVFTETALKVEEIRKNRGKIQKITDIHSKKICLKS